MAVASGGLTLWVDDRLVPDSCAASQECGADIAVEFLCDSSNARKRCSHSACVSAPPSLPRSLSSHTLPLPLVPHDLLHHCLRVCTTLYRSC